MTTAINRSVCCGAPAILDTGGATGFICHYFCTDCRQPCGIDPDDVIRCGHDVTKTCTKNGPCQHGYHVPEKCEYAIGETDQKLNEIKQN